MVQRIKARALYMLSTDSTTELDSQPFLISYFETGSSLIAQTNLELNSVNLDRPELMVLLPHLPKYLGNTVR